MRMGKILRRTALILAGVLLLFSAVSLLLVHYAMADTFARVTLGDYSARLRYEDVAEAYAREAVSFDSGGNLLHGWLYGAENSGGLVVISHGMGGGGVEYLAETLYFVDEGFRVLAYDNTGCHESAGESCVGLSQSVLDLDAALTWVEEQARFAGVPVFLYGHSWGGYAVTAVLAFGHRVTASASVAGFNDPMAMILDWATGMLGGFITVEAPFIWLDQRWTFGEVLELTAVDGINAGETPVLLIHGTGDTVVGYDSVSISAARGQITNPNVSYLVRSQPPQDGHNTLIQSLDAIAYNRQLDAAYEALRVELGGTVTPAADRAFCGSIDKVRASAVDKDFLAEVAAFYRACG